MMLQTNAVVFRYDESRLASFRSAGFSTFECESGCGCFALRVPVDAFLTYLQRGKVPMCKFHFSNFSVLEQKLNCAQFRWGDPLSACLSFQSRAHILKWDEQV